MNISSINHTFPYSDIKFAKRQGGTSERQCRKKHSIAIKMRVWL